MQYYRDCCQTSLDAQYGESLPEGWQEWRWLLLRVLLCVLELEAGRRMPPQRYSGGSQRFGVGRAGPTQLRADDSAADAISAFLPDRQLPPPLASYLTLNLVGGIWKEPVDARMQDADICDGIALDRLVRETPDNQPLQA